MVDPEVKNQSRNNLVFKEDFNESFVEKFEQKGCLIGYQGLGMLKANLTPNDTGFLLSHFGMT